MAASKIHRQIVEVYGDKAMNGQQVAKWCRSYKANREHAENRNMEESVRPSNSRTDLLYKESTQHVLKKSSKGIDE